MSAVVAAVSCSATHDCSKPNQESIQLLTGLGVKVDSHSGETVKQRARVALDPNKPNLRQVHLIHRNFTMSYKPPGSTYQRERWVRTSPRTAPTY